MGTQHVKSARNDQRAASPRWCALQLHMRDCRMPAWTQETMPAVIAAGGFTPSELSHLEAFFGPMDPEDLGLLLDGPADTVQKRLRTMLVPLARGVCSACPMQLASQHQLCSLHQFLHTPAHPQNALMYFAASSQCVIAGSKWDEAKVLRSALPSVQYADELTDICSESATPAWLLHPSCVEPFVLWKGGVWTQQSLRTRSKQMPHAQGVLLSEPAFTAACACMRTSRQHGAAFWWSGASQSVAREVQRVTGYV